MKTLFLAFMFILSALNGNETRYDTGIVTAKTYHEVGDYTELHIVSSDGNEWLLSDTIAPLNSQCIIEFDTKGTESVLDDEITAIMYLDIFEGGN